MFVVGGRHVSHKRQRRAGRLFPACATSRRPRNRLISPQAPPAWWPGSPLLAALGQPTAAPSPGGVQDQIRIGTGMALLTTPPQASGPAFKWHVLGRVKQISNAHAAVYIARACMLALLYHGGCWRIGRRRCAEPHPLSLYLLPLTVSLVSIRLPQERG